MIGKAFGEALTRAVTPESSTTYETVQAVLADGRYVVRGAIIPATGDAKLTAGARVAVSWRQGRPAYIHAHHWTRGGAPIIRRALSGVIEELSMTSTFELIYRNDQQIANLGRAFWAGDIVTVTVLGLTFEILVADVTWGDRDGTLLVTTRVPVTPPTVPGRTVPFVREEQFHHYVCRLTGRARNTPAGSDTVGLELVSAQTGPVFSTGLVFAAEPTTPVEHPYDFAEGGGVATILGVGGGYSAPLFHLTSELMVLEVGRYRPGDFVPAVVGPSGILFTPTVSSPTPSGCWVAQWHDTDPIQRRVLVWGEEPNPGSGLVGNATVALWVERPGLGVERILFAHAPTTGDAGFEAVAPALGPFDVLRQSSGLSVTSASAHYVTWLTGAQQFVVDTFTETPLWTDTVIRHYLSDLDTGATIQIARYEVATAPAPFLSGDRDGIDNAAVALRIAHLQPGWLMQAKRTTQNGAIAFTFPTVYTDLPTRVSPVKFRTEGALSFDLSAWQATVGVDLVGAALPSDGRFDRDLFDLKTMPVAQAATLSMTASRRPVYHVVPDAELGRTSQ